MNEKPPEKTTYTTAKAVMVLALIIAVVIFVVMVSEPTPEKPKPDSQSDSQSMEMPMGTWSKTYRLKPGCSIRYDAGIGTYYNVRYRYGSEGWKIHPGLSAGSPIADQIQFMKLKEGGNNIPFTITCNK
jgi:hypothetical protein